MSPQPDTFRNVLALALIGAFTSAIPLFVFKTIPAENKEIIVYMVGQLSGMALMALGFYFTNKAGQDELDAKRADTTGKAFEAITASAQASGASDPNALKQGDTVTLDRADEPLELTEKAP